ncbi:DJ-1 family glyoxalase III [Gynuella sunshinyii]|uniref:Putative intracellular protease/amidase n=1 Tax=Gynuella sunshinyii YC6258 TaxID=1445510 RepID=A0A0C5VJE7_9GAMM|nr:DJ-1 family glyoxalase III [Gynuella sunshinyii]AJQ94411.1 putative intracellular protease/amidase [Gynuella sunshinyii YC6258]
MSKTILMPLANGFEELEAITISDLLVRAGVKVITAGLEEGPVRASRGTVVIPTTTLKEVMHQVFDLIVLPGGQPGADNLMADECVIDLLRQQHDQGKLIGAICAAPKVLVAAGIAEHQNITSYPGAVNHLDLTNVTVVNEPVVFSHNIVTSRGPGTAMKFALTLVEALQGAEVREKVETALEG